MLPRNLRPRCAALGLLIALALSPTAGHAAASSRPTPRSESVWAWLAYTFQCALVPGGCTAPQGSPGSLDLDEGCRIDPSGACLPQASQSRLDAGCRIDEHGAACRQAASELELDAGCRLDPHGCPKP